MNFDVSPYMWVHSSHGKIKVDKTSGECVAVYNEKGDRSFRDNELLTIVKFDIDEYEKKYGPAPYIIDILDLGYWTDHGHYEEPAHDWREDRDAGTFKSIGQP